MQWEGDGDGEVGKMVGENDGFLYVEVWNGGHKKSLKKVERKNEFEMEVIGDGKNNKKKMNKRWIT